MRVPSEEQQVQTDELRTVYHTPHGSSESLEPTEETHTPFHDASGRVFSERQAANAGGRAILARFSKCAKDNADPHIWRVGALIEEIRKFENRARIAAGRLWWFAKKTRTMEEHQATSRLSSLSVSATESVAASGVTFQKFDHARRRISKSSAARGLCVMK